HGRPVGSVATGAGWQGAVNTLTALRNIVHALRGWNRSEEHTSELQSRRDLVCRLLLEKKKKNIRQLLPLRPPSYRIPASRPDILTHSRTSVSIMSKSFETLHTELSHGRQYPTLPPSNS